MRAATIENTNNYRVVGPHREERRLQIRHTLHAACRTEINRQGRELEWYGYPVCVVVDL